MCAKVQCILANSGFPSTMWGELFMAAPYLKSRNPHKALKREAPFKMLHSEEADLSHLPAHQGFQRARRRGLGREGAGL